MSNSLDPDQNASEYDQETSQSQITYQGLRHHEEEAQNTNSNTTAKQN